MTSRQDDGRVLGFTRALVLCYTKPGKSKEILYRLQAKLQSFQLIDFTIDRYELDSVMSDYYNLETNSFVNSYNASGTISCNSSSTVTGTDTVFTEELAVGQTISVNGVAIGRIMEIVSDTELYLFQAYSEIIEDQLFSHTIGETTFDRSSTATTFDHEKTRFFGDRVTYTTPSQGDKYLKFPQIGVLE
jgi:hypothetical protein